MDRSFLPVEAFLEPFRPEIRAIAEALRVIVRAALPDVVERVRPGWRLIGYDIPHEGRLRYFAYVAPEAGHVHLGFEHGVHMDDPDGALLGAGITRKVRWLTYRSIAEVDVGAATGFLHEAARIARLPAPLRALAGTRSPRSTRSDDPLLRRATAEDVPAIRALVHDAYVGYTPLLGRTPIPLLADYDVAVREHEVWVLETGGALVGIIELIPRPDALWVENVAIAPGHQRRGHGRRLLAHAEDRALELGYTAIELLTNERYVDNIAMYERYGYRETHREPHLGTDLVHFRKTRGR